jgi:hypothetical protein
MNNKVIVYDWQELVDFLKEEELDSNRLLLITDDLLKAAAAWPYIWKEPPEDLESDNVWEGLKYDIEDWVSLSGFENVAKFKRMIPKMITLNVIYPDGTLPKDIELLILKRIDKQFGTNLEKFSKENSKEE